MAYAVTALFASGHLLLASGLSFVAGLMDGFDGKLARVKGMTTRVGAMEHSFDLLFEFSWLAASRAGAPGFVVSSNYDRPDCPGIGSAQGLHQYLYHYV